MQSANGFITIYLSLTVHGAVPGEKYVPLAINGFIYENN